MNEFHSEIEDSEIASVADLAEQVVYRLGGCDTVTVRKTLQSAYADFARATKCFTTWYEFRTNGHDLVYRVSATLPKMYVDSICAVWLDGRRLVFPVQYKTSVLYGQPTIILRDSTVGGMASSRYALDRPNGDSVLTAIHRRVERMSFEPHTVRVRLVEMPKIGSECAPSWFLDKYGEAVVSGALIRLLGMANKPWSDPQQAQAELVRYENFTTSARIDSASEDGSPVGNGHIDTIDTSGLL